MNRLISIFVMMVAMTVGGGALQAQPVGDPPDITVSLALDKTSYTPGQPITVTLALANQGGDVITVEGFLARQFYLMLLFTDESGTIVTSDEFSGTSTPFPALPRVFPEVTTGELIQGDLVEIVEADWVLAYDAFDAYRYYALANKANRYSVKAVIPIRTYLDYLQTDSGIRYAPLASVDFYGSLESNAASFTLVGDGDGDGYYYPEGYGEHAQPDCDDTNADVNPSAAEIPQNGLDDDCNPATADVALVVPGTIEVKVEKHTTGKKGKKSKKEPIKDLVVKVYDKSAGSCVAGFGVSHHHYKSVWLSCVPQQNGVGSTDAKGKVVLEVAPGDYVIVAEYDPDFYAGAADQEGNETYLGVSAGDLAEGQYMKKYLQLKVKPQ